MNIGIIGTGRIASRFVDTALQGVESSSVYCVYNPRIESAEKFAVKHSIPVYTSDLDIFLENVDAVYIASPHETHYMYSRRALEAGKHVLCEKPMALKKSDVKELIELAKKNGLVCMEALKTKYCPGYKALINAAKSGKIGRIVDVEAAFSRLTKLNTREYMNDIYNDEEESEEVEDPDHPTFVTYWKAAGALYDIIEQSNALFHQKNNSTVLGELAVKALHHIILLREAKIPERYWYPDIMNWLLFKWYQNRNYNLAYLLKLYDEHEKNDMNKIEKLKLQNRAYRYQHSVKKLLRY